MNTSLFCENRRRCILIRGGHFGSVWLVKSLKVVHAMAIIGFDVIVVCMQIYNWNEVIFIKSIVSLEAL